MKVCMFRTVPLSIIRSFSPYTAMVYVRVCHTSLLTARMHDQDVPSWSFSQAVSKPVWDIPLLCVQWKPPDDGQRNCPKHVEFHSKNKFEKLEHLVGFIIINLSRFTATWTSRCCGCHRSVVEHVSNYEKPSFTYLVGRIYNGWGGVYWQKRHKK
jgi:hypothetical protein